MMLIEKSFDTGEVMLNYAEGPDNGPPLLFIHGALGRWEDFTGYIPQFTDHFHVYAIDTRGRGKSGRTPGKYKIKNMVEDVTTFINKQIRKPTVLIGHSEGGWISLWTAHKSPENVSALVILDSPITLDDFIFQATEGEMKEGLQRTKEHLGRPVEDIAAILRDIDPLRSMEAIEWSAKCQSLADPEYFTLWAEGRFDEYYEDYDAWRFLSDVSCPVMLYQADPDEGALLSHEDVDKARKIKPDIHHEIIHGVGHNLGMNPGEDPLDINPILSFLEFLR